MLDLVTMQKWPWKLVEQRNEMNDKSRVGCKLKCLNNATPHSSFSEISDRAHKGDPGGRRWRPVILHVITYCTFSNLLITRVVYGAWVWPQYLGVSLSSREGRFLEKYIFGNCGMYRLPLRKRGLWKLANFAQYCSLVAHDNRIFLKQHDYLKGGSCLSNILTSQKSRGGNPKTVKWSKLV